MIYETFLFTRNQQHDFKAFIRPHELTNKDVSTIASALNNINNVSDLTPDWPALYSFPIGQYHMLLRHYDSGRTHAGRNIGIVEGIAVRRSLQRHYTLAVPHFLAQQETVLAIADGAGNIETLTVTESEEYDWPDVQAEDTQAADDEIINEFIARLAEDRLFVPFTQDGRALLISALSDPRLRTAYFAFGTNSDVLSRLRAGGIDVDIVSYFNTTLPSLRNRDTNEITSELTDFVGKLPPRPKGRVVVETESDYPTDKLPTPRQVRDAMKKERANPEDDPLAKYDAGEDRMLTPREMRRRERQQAAAPEPAEETRSWLLKLLARLLGRG